MKKESSLVLEDFLLPREVIKFQSGRVNTLNDFFDFYITDQRILLHRRRGVVFKKDRGIELINLNLTEYARALMASIILVS